MGKPVTLLESLCEHALKFDAHSLSVERRDGGEWVFIHTATERIRVARFPDSGNDAQELRGNLDAVMKKPIRTAIRGEVYILKIRASENSGDDFVEVGIDPAPKLDPSVAPSFTPKQGQYLAFIYNYMKIHREAPSESDLQYYFRVSPPSVHDMIKTLERNGLIARTPGKARSIRLLVQPQYLPRLG